MFNFLSRKHSKKKATESIKSTDLMESLTFNDLLEHPLVITREPSGNNLFLGLQVGDKKVILDGELCVLLMSVLKEYCMTNDIKNSLEMVKEKEN